MNNLIWQQDFRKGNTDLSLWNIRVGNDLLDDDGNAVDTGWGNNEQQYYMNHESNLYLDESGLNLCARRKKVEENDRQFFYTSARIDTRDLFSFCYGKLIVRAKLPTGHGIWPAIWMLPQDKAYGNWPVSGEIDIMEAKGRLPQHIFGTLHHGKDMGENKITEEFSYRFGNGTIEDYHDYGLEWTAGSMKWLVDGHCFAERRLEPGVTPFDKPFYLVLNLAVGGWFDQVSVDNDAFPAIMTVSGIWLYK